MRLSMLSASVALAFALAVGACAWFVQGDIEHSASASADMTPRGAMSAAQSREPVDMDQASDEQPTDASGWAALGRSFAAQGDHVRAIAAFRQAARLRPDDATLLAEYAFSAAVTSQRRAADDPQHLVDRALQLDPKNTTALALAGTLALDRSDYDAATRHWQHLEQLEPPDSRRQRELHASIAQTRQLANAQAGRIETVGAR
jgi:cytochrome c-type biogenesis protein CcmH/NrfG